MAFSDRLAELRKTEGLSQQAFAEKIGVSKQTAAKWESGEALPDPAVKNYIITLFGLAPDYFERCDEDPDPVPPCDVPEEPYTAPPVTPVPPAPPVPAEEEEEEDEDEGGGSSSFKKVIAVVLALCVVAAAACFPLYSKSLKKLFNKIGTTREVKYTYVLVHGLGGWGEAGSLDGNANYWGGTTGNLALYLRNEGYDVCVPGVGPVSSAWDRACELYAQLTGTRVDYGEAHSKEHNHQRFGRTYTSAMVENWGETIHGEKVKVNLVGHSFGGTTVRLLASLLAQGSEAERKACEDVSPLFEGGKEDWVYSITTLCAPHNGSSLTCIADLSAFSAIVDTSTVLVDAVLAFADLLVPKGGILDFMLDQFGITNGSGDNAALKKMIGAFLGQGTDNAIYDLSPDGAAALNKQISLSDKIYYFSYSYCTTKKGSLLGGTVPSSGTLSVLKAPALAIGAYEGKTKGGIVIDESWHPNDGLVSVVSAEHPAGDKFTALPQDTASITKGIWNVAETREGDHGTVIGLMASADSTHRFYDELFTMIDSLER